MPIKVACRCGRTLIVPDQRAGRSVQCPKCRERIDVPGPPPTESPAPSAPAPQLAATSQRNEETAVKKQTDPRPTTTVHKAAANAKLQRESVPAPALATASPKPAEKPRLEEKDVAPAPAAKETDRAAEAKTNAPAAEAKASTPPQKPLPEKNREPAPSAAPELPEPTTATESPSSQAETRLAPEPETVDEAPPAPPVPPPPPETVPPEISLQAPVAPPVAEPAAQPVTVGYHPDAEKLTAAYVLAMLVALLGLFSMIPGVLDVVRYLSDTESAGVGRWAFVVFFLGLIHLAYALYLGQLPDWSSSWVLTAMSLLQASIYAAVLTAVYMVGGQSQIAQMLDLGPHIDNGQATAWCFVMLCLTGLVAYFCGHVSMRWRRAFLVLRAAHRH